MFKQLRLSLIAFLTAVSILALTPLASATTVREGQWQLDALNATAAQAISRGSGVIVAVIDTGVEVHPDLVGHVLTGNSFGKAKGLSAQEDLDGHGTAMAGLIAGQGGGANNVLGIAPGVQILPVRIQANKEAYGSGEADSAALSEAIRWSVDNGAKVINISLAASGSPTDAQTAAVSYALSKDVVVVVGAGNGDTSQLSIGQLALVPGVIVVNATDRSGTAWEYSLTGPQVTITAPGVDLVTTGSRAAGSQTGFYIGSGTSDATALVSGAAALIRSKYPTLNASDVINRLIVTADDAGSAGRDQTYGFGRLDVVRALTENVAHVDKNPLGTPTATGTNSNGSSSTGSDNFPVEARITLVVLGLLVVVVIVVIVIVKSSRRSRFAHSHAPQMPPAPMPPSANMPGHQPHVVQPQDTQPPQAPRHPQS